MQDRQKSVLHIHKLSIPLVGYLFNFYKTYYFPTQGSFPANQLYSRLQVFIIRIEQLSFGQKVDRRARRAPF